MKDKVVKLKAQVKYDVEDLIERVQENPPSVAFFEPMYPVKNEPVSEFDGQVTEIMDEEVPKRS